MSQLLSSLLFAGLAAAACAAETPAPAAPPAAAPTTDPAYSLSPGDTIAITVYNEPELSATQMLGRAGEVRLLLLGDMVLGGKNIRAAERALEAAYRDRQFLKAPMVSVVVAAYNPREVSVLGAVRAPGPVMFPRDATSLDIVEVITRVGGFLPVAKSDAVTITHRLPDGTETVTSFDLENMMTGRRQPGRDRANVLVFPGDRVWVPERLF